MTPTGSSAVPSDLCSTCGYGPCACSYISKLQPAAECGWLRASALAAMNGPLPHRPGCPCPGCYSDRVRSWESGQVTAASVLITTPSTREDVPA